MRDSVYEQPSIDGKESALQLEPTTGKTRLKALLKESPHSCELICFKNSEKFKLFL